MGVRHASGLADAIFAWGDEERPGGELKANSWQGDLPRATPGGKQWRGTSPVGRFPANGYGLYDTTGKVCEWTTDYPAAGDAGTDAVASPCCRPPTNPRVETADATYDIGRPGAYPTTRDQGPARTSARRPTAFATDPRPASPKRSTLHQPHRRPLRRAVAREYRAATKA